MSKKIAPALTKWVRVPFREDPRTLHELNLAADELDALLACARELRDIARARKHESDCLCSMCRALSRLDRLSSGTGKRKGGSRG